MDIHDIQKFTTISKFYSEFWLVGPSTVTSGPPSGNLCPPGSNLLLCHWIQVGSCCLFNLVAAVFNRFSDDNLVTVMDKNKYLPDRIYNMDETRITAIQHYRPFVMIAVTMTCQMLKHQREIVCL